MTNGEFLQKIYVTKYALSTGIFLVEAEIHPEFKGMASYKLPGCYSVSVHGNDWWFSRSDALNRAEEMRKKKIASLEKMISKIKSIKFEVEEK